MGHEGDASRTARRPLSQRRSPIKTTSKTSRNDRNRQAIAGVQKHITSTVVLDGVSYPPAQVVSVLQDAITKTDATAAAEGAYHQAVAAEDAATTLADSVFEALKGVVLNQFKGQPTVLSDFGLTEPVRKEPSAATKAAAAAKRKATLAAKKAAKAATATREPATPPATPKS
jgi:hypothetical protein